MFNPSSPGCFENHQCPKSQEEIATFATHYLINTSTNDGTVQGPADVMMLLPCHVAILSADQHKTTQTNQKTKTKVRPTTPHTTPLHKPHHLPFVFNSFAKASKIFFFFMPPGPIGDPDSPSTNTRSPFATPSGTSEFPM